MVVGWLFPWVCIIGAGACAFFAIVVLFRHPWLWLRSTGVLATSTLLLAGGPVLWATSRDDFFGGLSCDYLAVFLVVGPWHLGFLLILIGSEIQECQWDVNK